MSELTDREVEKITRRYTGLTSSQTVVRLREKYTRRRQAVEKFTDRLQKSGFVDQEEILSLRALGVSEEEIKALVENYGAI
ncbi:MAG: hypothetical protein ICCCNLDF_03349 [Planctomycetes bacterium]|nr:hypothetical protein [Planctomycetota bacterium]